MSESDPVVSLFASCGRPPDHQDGPQAGLGRESIAEWLPVMVCLLDHQSSTGSRGRHAAVRRSRSKVASSDGSPEENGGAARRRPPWCLRFCTVCCSTCSRPATMCAFSWRSTCSAGYSMLSPSKQIRNRRSRRLALISTQLKSGRSFNGVAPPRTCPRNSTRRAQSPCRIWFACSFGDSVPARLPDCLLCAALTWAEAWSRDSRVNGGSSRR